MQYSKHRVPTLLITLFLVVLVLPAFGENLDVYELTVPNTPIKGIIRLEKQGPVLTGFTEHQDPFGNMVHTPVYKDGWPEGAVFEVRAVEDIVGRDGTLWFKANELADTIVTTSARIDQSKPLPLGHYYVTEVSAPGGYAYDGTRYDVLLEAQDRKTSIVTADILAVNGFMPTRISLVKEKQIINTVTDDAGMIHTGLVNVPGEGFIFGLFNTQAISYPGGSLPADSLIATAISDKKGALSFNGLFPKGQYEIREHSGSDGWEIDPAGRMVKIPDDAQIIGDEMVITLNTPIVNQLIHSDVRISKTDITGSDSLPHTLIEVRNESGKVILRDYTGEDGYLPPFPAVPGNYKFREVLAPQGYELCTTELTFTVAKDGTVEGKTNVADDCTRFSILKVDVRNNKPLPGVEFGLFRKDGSLQTSAVSDINGLATFEKVPYGSYIIQETKALPGYLKSSKRIPVTVDGTFVNPEKPIAIVENTHQKIMCIKSDPSGKPIPGVAFSLINAADMEVVETAISDKDGAFSFVNFGIGNWIIHENSAPAGYSAMKDIRFHVGDDWTLPKPILCVNIPDHYEFVKTDTEGKALKGVKFRLEDEKGTELGIYESDEQGVVSMTGLKPGAYIIREIETLKGFTLSGDVNKVKLDEYYVVPEKMKQWINYTTIQTGVHMAVTGVMWAGLAMMVISGTALLVKKRRQHKA